jgi:transposase
MLRQFERHLTDKNWHEVQEGVEVKLVAGPEGNEAFILARSTDRRQKENAMHQRFITRMELDLQKMQRSAASGRLKDIQLAHRRLGRIQQRYWRASGAFDIKVVPIEKPTDKARLKVTFKQNKQWSDWAQLSEGCYLLRTNLTDMDPKILWKRYIQLTEAEWAFRIAKNELVIRPIWHQKADRVKAHILVCFLAYVLWKSLSQWMRRAGLGDAPRTLLEEFAKIKSGDVVLPTRTSDGRKAKTVRLRCVTAPDQAQKVLLHRLGLNLPQRLRRIDEVAQM